MADKEWGKPCNMKPIKETSIKTRRKFDETFKREAVQNWLASDKSAAVIAQEQGLHADRLYAWKKRFAPADAGGRAAAGAKPGSLQAPLTYLRLSRARSFVWMPPKPPLLKTQTMSPGCT